MKVARHIVDARREKLAKLLERHRYLSVPELCAQLGISEATARRDLEALSKDDRILRTHGGALPELEKKFTPLQDRTNLARKAKERIAMAALKFVREGGTYYLDGGTTTLALARLLCVRPLGAFTILTNNLAAADLLSQVEEFNVRLLGGRWLHRQAMLVGKEATHALRTWKIDGAFFSAEGMNTAGVWNTNPEVIALQHAIQEKAAQVWFCLDATKLGLTTPHLLKPWSEVPTLITDANPAQLSAAKIKLRPKALVSV